VRFFLPKAWGAGGFSLRVQGVVPGRAMLFLTPLDGVLNFQKFLWHKNSTLLHSRTLWRAGLPDDN
jgi:hypothetical protein